jgi:phosphopantothenate-cysteine ligase
MNILLTSGGTRVPIDRVRSITNMSRGTFGAKLARAMLWTGVHYDKTGIYSLGHSLIDEFTFLYARDSRRPYQVDVNVADDGYSFIGAVDQLVDTHKEFIEVADGRLHEDPYVNFDEYAEKLSRHLGELLGPQLVVLATAASDFIVQNYVDGKIRSQADLDIHMAPAEKLIGTVKAKCPDCKLVGFKLLVDSTDEELISAARKSIDDNGCDMVLANDLRDIQNSQHRIHIVTPDGCMCFEDNRADPFYLPRIIAKATMALVADNVEPVEVQTWAEREYYDGMDH